MITIFTPSFADEGNINAQNLTVKEIVARLPGDRFRIVMLCDSAPDARLRSRRNTILLPSHEHLNSARWLVQVLSYRPDIYFFPREGPLDAAFFFLRKVFGLNTAVVSYMVSGSLHQEVQSTGTIRNIQEADEVVVNSLFLAESLLERFAVQASVAYDGVDPRFFYPREGDTESTKLTVLYAGSFRSYKRPDLLVREAAKWPDVTFGLAGQGEEEFACQRLAQELRCTNVEFLGRLTQQQLGDQMKQADVFFFPSVLEGHPQVLLQAAACGVPVIALNCYRPEYVANGVSGFLCDSDADLSDKLGLLLGNAELRLSMSEAASRHARKFDWDAIAQQWAGIFQRIAQKHADDLVACNTPGQPLNNRQCEF